jgi:hypothetical protein
MSTVSPALQTGKSIVAQGAFAFWTAKKTKRSDLASSFAAAGESVDLIPAINHYDALVRCGNTLVEKCALKERSCPVKWDSLSRSGVGVEFWKLYKGEGGNQRTPLFSIGVGANGKAFVIQHSSAVTKIQTLFSHQQIDAIVDGLYQQELEWMNARDVTEALRGVVMRHRGVSVKETGGVYFVPDCGLSPVDSLFASLNQHGNRCTLLIQDLSQNEELRRQVIEAAQEDMESTLQKMVDTMQDLVASDKKPRGNGQKTRMAEIQRIADLCDYYEKTFQAGLATTKKLVEKSYELLSELYTRYNGAE